MGGILVKNVTISGGEKTFKLNVAKVGSKEFKHFKDTTCPK